ncbi:MAG: cbb3-type cytochrome oxidase subunit 3 [Gammaproteobacteria bacterium]
MDAFLSAWTVVAAVIFLGVTAWAWSAARRQEFDEAARIPLDDDETDKLENGVR